MFCMLIVSASLMAQQMTERHRNGVIAKQYTLDKDGNYHGTYTEYSRAGKPIIKQNYFHGELHGIYIGYFDNGTVPAEESVYHKGVRTSHKEWDYFGGKKYLMYSGTWTKEGKLLTEGKRSYDSWSGLGDWIDLAGQLPNGRWYLAGSTKDANYVEQYNGNDTLYVWFDKTKEQFRGKGIDGKGYIYEWDENGTLLKSPEKELAEKLEKVRQDSIATAKKLEEELRIKNELQARQDTLKQLKESFEKTAQLYAQTDSLYYVVLKDCVEAQNINTSHLSSYDRYKAALANQQKSAENQRAHKLYSFFSKYMAKKKKKPVEIELQKMISEASGLEIGVKGQKTKIDNSIRKYIFGNHLVGESLNNDIYYKTTRANSGLYKVDVLERLENMYESKKYDEAKVLYEDMLKVYNEIGEEYANAHKLQLKLIHIMEYCTTNSIKIK